MHAFLESVTRFGSVLVCLPLMLLLALWLWLLADRRSALEWLALVVAVVGIMGLTKLYLAGCHLRYWDIRSPSGHASMSLLAYGAYAIVLLRRSPGWQRWLLGSLAVAWIALIGYSRVALHAHTTAEVIGGWCVSGLALGIFVLRYRGQLRRSPRALLAAALIGFAISQATIGRVSPERWLAWLGHQVAQLVPMCPAPHHR